MHRIPHCPNPLCPSNKAESEIKPSFRKKGFESNKRQEKIQRYQCKNCRQTFNINVFDINYYAHKSIDYKRLVDAMISSSGIRDMARQFRCSPSLIQNRIDRLARKAMALFAKLSKTLELKEDVAADGLEPPRHKKKKLRNYINGLPSKKEPLLAVSKNCWITLQHCWIAAI
jgi:transposase-like protein